MTTKDLAKRLIDALPDDATFADIGYALHVRSRIERGDERAGNEHHVARGRAREGRRDGRVPGAGHDGHGHARGRGACGTEGLRRGAGLRSGVGRRAEHGGSQDENGQRQAAGTAVELHRDFPQASAHGGAVDGSGAAGRGSIAL